MDIAVVGDVNAHTTHMTLGPQALTQTFGICNCGRRLLSAEVERGEWRGEVRGDGCASGREEWLYAMSERNALPSEFLGEWAIQGSLHRRYSGRMPDVNGNRCCRHTVSATISITWA